MQQTNPPARLVFHFDPLCPLAWRTALWIREARAVRPIEVTWKFFSLEAINRKEGATPDFAKDGAWPAQRVMALARRQGGNDAVERLYLTLGAAQHGRKESIRDLAVIRAAVRKAELPESLLDAALADDSTTAEVQAEHAEAVTRYRAFGVPTIAYEGSNVGFYGPIIQDVPRGAEAGEYWDHFSWLLQQPNMFELKRDRAAGQWLPIAE